MLGRRKLGRIGVVGDWLEVSGRVVVIVVYCGKLVWKGLELFIRSFFRIRVMYVLVKKYLYYKGIIGEYKGVIVF